MKTLKLTYEEVHGSTVDLVNKIDPQILSKIDVIAAPSNGGIIPGIILSYHLKKRFTPIEWSDNIEYRTHRADLSEELFNGLNILLVDDINNTGNTFINITSDLMYTCAKIPTNTHKGRIYTASIYQRYNTKFVCDYISKIIPDNVWLEFPWNPKNG